MKPTPKPDPIKTVKDEIADYERQFAEAQQQAGVWNQKVLLSNGALQACQALLAKLVSVDQQETAPPQ